MKISEIIGFLDGAAPFSTAESFDNVGLLVGSEDTEVKRIMCCLDITRAVVLEAAEKGAELIVSHHPVIFSGLKNIPSWSPVRLLIEKNIAAIAVHTNFDIADGGVNDELVKTLGFEKLETLEVTQPDGKGFGAVCKTPKEFSPRELALYCRKKLGGCIEYSAGLDETVISRAAVCCGAGVDEKVMRLAQEKNCGAIISGDIKHNFRVEAVDRGIALIDAGHYGTEIAAKNVLKEMLSKHFPDICVYASETETDPCSYV